jgi:hypothetical protein
VSDLYDVDEAIEVIRGKDEAVALHHVAPPAQDNVTAQRILKKK